MGKLRGLGEVKWLTQSHTAGKWVVATGHLNRATPTPSRGAWPPFWGRYHLHICGHAARFTSCWAGGPPTLACLVFWTKLPALHSRTALSACVVLSALRNVLRLGLEPSPSGLLSNPAPPSDQPSGGPLTTPPSDAGALLCSPMALSSQGKIALNTRATGSNPEPPKLYGPQQMG